MYRCKRRDEDTVQTEHRTSRFQFGKMHGLGSQRAEEWDIVYNTVWGQIMKALNSKSRNLYLVLTTASEHFKISNEAGILEKLINPDEKTDLEGTDTSGRTFSLDMIA